MLLWDVRKKNLFTVCQCVQSPEVKAEHLAQPGAGLHTSSLCQKRAALGGPGCPWLFLFHREVVHIESRSFGSDLRKPSKVSWSFGGKKLPRLDISTKKESSNPFSELEDEFGTIRPPQHQCADGTDWGPGTHSEKGWTNSILLAFFLRKLCGSIL